MAIIVCNSISFPHTTSVQLPSHRVQLPTTQNELAVTTAIERIIVCVDISFPRTTAVSLTSSTLPTSTPAHSISSQVIESTVFLDNRITRRVSSPPVPRSRSLFVPRNFDLGRAPLCQSIAHRQRPRMYPTLPPITGMDRYCLLYHSSTPLNRRFSLAIQLCLKKTSLTRWLPFFINSGLR